MPLKIKMGLSQKDVKQAIKQLEDYKKELIFKTKVLVERLAGIGVAVIQARMHPKSDGELVVELISPETLESGNHVSTVIGIKGRDVAFVEFGAGVYYNESPGSSPHPYGQSLGMLIGSYGKGHGLEDQWSFNGELKHGTLAGMPVWTASHEIQNQIRAIASEVFGGG